MTISPGSRLGPYEIVAPLGAGGMGEVWRAKDTRLDREVAIKILPEGFAQNEQFLARFEREAKTISSLNHPNICTLHDVGHEGGLHYLVMELIDGVSLADRLLKGPLPVHETLRYGAQVAEALDRAHRQGIVHRDLKPGNIMLTKSGAKLLDFGLARPASEESPVQGLTEMPTQAKPLTAEGTILGTFQYMAPEQLEGVEADARTDIFALGAVLYEMATGHRAFSGSTKTSLIAAIVSSQPEPVSSVVALAPPALDHVIRKCLEKDPDDRWQSAHDIAGELQWISETGTQAGVAVPITVRRKTRETLAWGTAAISIIALIGLATAQFQATPPTLESVELAITPPENGEIRLGNMVGWGIVSPDGTQVVFPAATNKGEGLWIRPIDRNEPRLLPGTARGYFPFWSPDGRWVGFFDSGVLKKVEIRGGLPDTICEVELGRGAAWGANGWILLSPIANGSLYRVRAEGGSPDSVTQLDSARGESAHYWPQWLPVDNSYLYFLRSDRPDLQGIYLGRLDDQGREVEKKRLVASSSSGVYAPDKPGSSAGQLLWVRDGRLVARTLDLDRGELTGDAVDLGIPVRVLEDLSASYISASETGALVLSRSEAVPGQLVWYDRAGNGPHALETPEGTLGMPAVAPDGRSVVYRVSGSGLWITDLGAGTTRLLDPLGWSPIWSPDSKSVIYMEVRVEGGAPSYRLRRLEVEGGEISTVSEAPGAAFPVAGWTPQGLIIGSYSEQGRTTIAAIDLANPSSIQSIPGDDVSSSGVLSQVATSPDGRWVTWAGGDTRSIVVSVSALVSANGKLSLGPRQQIPVESAVRAFWNPDGKEMFVLSQDRMLYALPVSTGNGGLRFGTPEPLFRKPPSASNFNDIAISPDGQHFYFTIDPGAKTRTLDVLLNWRARLEE